MGIVNGNGLWVSCKYNISGITTYYVWDSENPTGYPQVVEEIEGGQVVRRYGYGHFLENIDIWNGTSFDRYYVVMDGTNSVRMLIDSGGNVTDTFTWDAWGNLLGRTGTTPCNYGLHGECIDPSTNLVYLRARWYSPEIGRFMSMDEFEGVKNFPNSLNKYLFTYDNPINWIDPSGNFSTIEFGAMSEYFNMISFLPTVRVRGEETIIFPPLPTEFNAIDLKIPDPLQEIKNNVLLCLREKKFITSTFDRLGIFYNRVKSQAIWDYKFWYAEIKGEKSGNPHFELCADFGNFNFGVVGLAYGLNQTLLHLGAGWAQQDYYKKHGIPPGADPVYDWTMGDEVDDYLYIELGMTYWKTLKTKNIGLERMH